MAEEKTKGPTDAEKVEQGIQAGNALLQTIYGPPKPCPRPNWNMLPQLNMDAAPVFMFGVSCLPGKGKKGECSADGLFYALVIPYQAIQGKLGRSDNARPYTLPDGTTVRAWEAPGGNRYIAGEFKAYPGEPKTDAFLRIIAQESKKSFGSYVAGLKKQSVRNLDREVLQFIKDHKGRWVTQHGYVKVPSPNPGETLKQYMARGGFLLDMNKATGKTYLQQFGRRPWMDSSFEGYELWTNYDPVASKFDYSVRVVRKGWDDKTWDAIKTVASKFCGGISDGKVMLGMEVVGRSPDPYSQAAYISHKVLYAACNLPLPPDCIPQPLTPGEMPYVTVNVKGATVQGSIKAGTIWATGTLKPPIGGETLTQDYKPVYPPGTVAWFDPAAGGYSIGIAEPGKGTTHRVLTYPDGRPVILTKLPHEGIYVLTTSQWQKATRPWLERRTTKIGMLAIGAAAIAGVALTNR